MVVINVESYSATLLYDQKRVLALVHFQRHFRYYLLLRKFTMQTDHAPIEWLRNFKDADRMLVRWSSVMNAMITWLNIDRRHQTQKRRCFCLCWLVSVTIVQTVLIRSKWIIFKKNLWHHLSFSNIINDNFIIVVCKRIRLTDEFTLI